MRRSARARQRAWGLPAPGRSRRPAQGRERVAHGHELRLGLGELGLGVGVGDDAAAGEQPDGRALDRRPSAARCPTRRRRRRPSSRPGRRTGRGPCPRSRRSGRSPPWVGVPPTAAEGCSASASCSEETVAASCTTPATSVARCMTLGRCSTNGASGTFIDEQCGSRASATERTAYSCSSRSFDERASVAARARSRLVVAGTPDGAGQHPRGDQAALAAHQHLGRRAEQAVDVEGPAHRVVLGQPAQRPADVDRLVGGGDQVAGQHDLLEVAGVDPGHGVGDDATSSARRRGRRRRSSRPPARRGVVGDLVQRHGRRRSACRGPIGGEPGGAAAAADDDLAARPARESPGSSANAKEPKQTRPGAGLVDLVADDGAGGGLVPPLVGVGEAGGAAGADLGGDAPADQPVAAAQPGDRAASVGQQVEQRSSRGRGRGGPCGRRGCRAPARRGSRWSSRGSSVRRCTGPRSPPGPWRRSRPVDDDLVADLHLVEEPGHRVVVADVHAAVRARRRTRAPRSPRSSAPPGRRRRTSRTASTSRRGCDTWSASLEVDVEDALAGRACTTRRTARRRSDGPCRRRPSAASGWSCRCTAPGRSWQRASSAPGWFAPGVARLYIASRVGVRRHRVQPVQGALVDLAGDRDLPLGLEAADRLDRRRRRSCR